MQQLAAVEASRSDAPAPLAFALGVVLAGLIGLAARLSLGRAFAVDEFAYAHAGWMIAQGAVPHLDFFETKFSGPLWLFSLVFSVGGDDPHLIESLRVFCWPFVAVVVAGVGLLNRRIHPLAPLATAVVLLANPVFTNTALEIRPDVVALAFLVAALVSISGSGRRRARGGQGRVGSGLATGMLLGLCAVCSAKAAIYAAPLVIVWLVERLRRDDDARLFGAPYALAAGFAAVVAGGLALLVATGSFEAFLDQAIAHNRQFLVGERWRPWQLDAAFVLMNAPWLHALALVGLATIAFPDATSPAQSSGADHESERRAERRGRRMDLVLVAMLATSFASHAIQLYPFLYSLLPFMAIEAVFAGRGLARIARWLTVWPAAEAAPLRRLVAVGLAGWTAIGVATAAALLHGIGAPSDGPQRALFDEIERVSAPGDAIYDNSGSYVSRRSAYFMPWTDAPIRARWAEKLVREVPLAIEASECVVAIVDERFAALPPALQRYVATHFKPWSGSVLLWGADFPAAAGGAESVFLANRSGAYRILPETTAGPAGLSIDGRPVTGTVVELARGRHVVRYSGESGGFRLQWLPGERRIAAR